MSVHEVTRLSTRQAESPHRIKFPDPSPRSTGQWVYHPGPEEIPVTFQIGALGDEGIILGSDRRAADESHGTRTTFDTPKIVVIDDLRLAYCYAGDLLAKHS